MQQSTSFNLDSRGNETMGGGGNITINWVEGRHGRGRGHNNYFEPQASEGDKVTSSENFG
jgi:hypothetical protein